MNSKTANYKLTFIRIGACTIYNIYCIKDDLRYDFRDELDREIV